MAAAILELNDHELRLEKDAQIVARSPGCAIVSGTNIEVGEAACKQAHLHPRDFHNRFWYQLNQASLRKSTRAARHHADLAFRHLEHIHKAAGAPETLVFAIPGGFSKEQLALLLGIADACKIKTLALVDAAVASAADCVAPGTYRHIEIQLHRAVVTDLVIDDHVSRGSLDVIDGAGFDKLCSRFVAFVADQFLAQSRFDPLHQAHTEQVLFNELPTWLQLLHTRREIKVHIEYRLTRFEARIARDDLIAVAQPTYNEIRDRIAARDRCLIGSRLAALPGFVNAPATQFILPESAVFGGCAEIAERTLEPSGGLTLLTRLKASVAPTIGASGDTQVPSGTAPAADPVTHVLCGARAYELGTTPLYLSGHGGAARSPSTHAVANLRLVRGGTEVAAENGARLRLNGLPVETSTAVAAGDEITVEGSAVVYLPISVVAPDAP
jgi:hypothetical protein